MSDAELDAMAKAAAKPEEHTFADGFRAGLHAALRAATEPTEKHLAVHAREVIVSRIRALIDDATPKEVSNGR